MTFIYMTDLNNWDISSTFPNSPLIKSAIMLLQPQGLFARSFVIDFIGGTLSCSKVLIRKKRLSPDDVDNFPLHLRRLIFREGLIFRFLLLWVIVLYLLLEFRGHSS